MGDLRACTHRHLRLRLRLKSAGSVCPATAGVKALSALMTCETVGHSGLGGGSIAWEEPRSAGYLIFREAGLRRAARIFFAIIFSLIVAVLTVWTALALWFRLPGPEWARGFAAVLFALFGLATVVASFSRFRVRALLLFAAAFGAVLIWWSTITPPADADWAPDVARQVTGTLDGDVLT